MNTDAAKVEATQHLLILPAALAALALLVLVGLADPLEWWRARTAPPTLVHRVAAMQRAYAGRQWDEAANEARAALARDPACAPALRTLAACALRSGRFAEAQTACETLIRQDPRDMDARMALALALRGRGENRKAAETLRAVAENPESTLSQRAAARAALGSLPL